MSDNSSRCGLCGRLTARLDAGYCSARCRSLADAGYTSPQHPAAALAPPSTAIEARVFVTGPLPEPLPRGCAAIAALADERTVVRVAADDWAGLDAVLAELRDRAHRHDVEIFTLQQFTPGGLAVLAQPSPIERC